MGKDGNVTVMNGIDRIREGLNVLPPFIGRSAEGVFLDPVETIVAFGYGPEKPAF